MGFFGNYDTPGRGVLKTPHEKRPFFKFWEVYFRHMWQLMGLNLVYFLFTVPLFAMLVLLTYTGNMKWLLLLLISGIIGPATAAMTRVARNYSQERPTFMLHDFRKAFKKNLKQGLVMGYIDSIVIVSFLFGVPMYSRMAQQNSIMYVPYVLSLSCMLVFFMMHFYIYQMMCSTNLTMKQILRNALFLVPLGLKNTIYTLVVSLLVIAFNYIVLIMPSTMPVGVTLLMFFPYAFLTFVACFNCYPVIRKNVIQPYYDKTGEKNPEEEDEDAEEALFEDKAAEEEAVPVQKKSKPKVIK